MEAWELFKAVFFYNMSIQTCFLIFVIFLFENTGNQLLSVPEINACIWMSSVDDLRYKRRSLEEEKLGLSYSCDAWPWGHWFSDGSALLSHLHFSQDT